MERYHVPVLQKEALEYLDPKPNENFVDCTIGEGGHALAILEKTAPNGKVLGIEWDSELFKKLKEEKLLKSDIDRLILVNDSYVNLKEIVKREKFRQARAQKNFVLGRAHKICAPISGILFDLGMSSWHLEESGRGFSFLRNEPLDMRYNLENPLTAEKILNYWSEPEIERILREFGEERFAKRIAREIVERRKIKPIKTTLQLVEIIKKVTPLWYHRQKIHFATRTFQALRIAVNEELNNLEKVLPQTIEILKPGGRLVIISFHSLEDRIVKNFYRARSSVNELKILTKKPIRPSKEEIKINPRSRSAKLRTAIKI